MTKKQPLQYTCYTFQYNFYNSTTPSLPSLVISTTPQIKPPKKSALRNQMYIFRVTGCLPSSIFPEHYLLGPTWVVQLTTADPTCILTNSSLIQCITSSQVRKVKTIPLCPVLPLCQCLNSWSHYALQLLPPKCHQTP